jgi:hypothetical protein
MPSTRALNRGGGISKSLMTCLNSPRCGKACGGDGTPPPAEAAGESIRWALASCDSVSSWWERKVEARP